MPNTLQGPGIAASDLFAVVSVPIPHAHRWRIDEAAGPNSSGCCGCGDIRAFTNGWDAGPTGWLAYRSAAAGRAQ